MTEIDLLIAGVSSGIWRQMSGSRSVEIQCPTLKPLPNYDIFA